MSVNNKRVKDYPEKNAPYGIAFQLAKCEGSCCFAD